MAHKRIKRTTQEWLDLIMDCKTSGLTIRAWCRQHDVSVKSFYAHVRELRELGYDIPGKATAARPEEKQEAFCLDLFDESPDDVPASSNNHMRDGTLAIRIDFHGVLIEVANQAAQETITNTFHALRELC